MRALSRGSPEKLIGTSPTPNTLSMLNWPGSNPVQPPVSSARSSVCTPGASCWACSTRARRGTISSVARRSARCGIEIENLQPCGVELLDNERRDALHHLIAKVVVGLALVAQTFGIERDRPRHLHGAGIEGPA